MLKGASPNKHTFCTLIKNYCVFILLVCERDSTMNALKESEWKSSKVLDIITMVCQCTQALYSD